MATSDFTEFSKSLAPIFNELRNATRSLSLASEKLSNTGLDKLTEQVKKNLKQQGLINDIDSDAIKNAKTLNKVLTKLEDQYEEILKLERKAQQIAEKSLKDNYKDKQASEAIQKAALKAARDSLKSKYDELELTDDMVDAIKKGIPVIREDIELRTKLISKTDALSKEYDNLRGKVTSQVEGFVSLAASTGMLKKAFFTSYEQMNRMSSRGMLGAFTTINLLAPKLLLSAKEFEELMTTNRDLVNSMGGGLKGMTALAKEAGEVRTSLKFLGEDASKASFRFIELSKKSGLTLKNGVAYHKNMKATIDQFTEFSGLFGDTYEEYAGVIEQLQAEEQTRKRLNSVTEEQRLVQMEELRERTKNLKYLGLSNQQILEFNKSANSLIDPRKNNIAERQTSAIMFKQFSIEMARILGTSNDPNDKKALAGLVDNQAGINEYARLMQLGNAEAIAKFKLSEQGSNASKALSAAAVRTDNVSDLKRFNRNIFLEKSGNLSSIVTDGDTLNTAEAQDKNIKKTAEHLKEVEENAKKMAATSGFLAEALNAATHAIQGFKVLIENPFVMAIGGAISGLLLFKTATSSIVRGLLSSVATLFKSGGKAAISSAGSAAGSTAMAAAKGGGKAAVGGSLLGGGIAWWELSEQEEKLKKGEITEAEFNKNAAKILGGASGAWAGAAMGAGVGSVVPVVGTVLGAIGGGALGYFGGSSVAGLLMGMYGGNKSTGSRESSGKITGATSTSPSTNGAVSTPSSVNSQFNFGSYAEKVGNRESSGRYNIMGGSSGLFAGKYQMGAAALVDGGMIKKSAFDKYKERAIFHEDSWTIPGGLSAFLNNPSLQDKAMKKYTDSNLASLKKNGIITSSSSSAQVAGHLAASHLVGANKYSKNVKSGTSSSDAFGTKDSEYYKIGASSQTAPFTGSSTVSAVTPRMLDNQIEATNSAAMPASVASASISSDPNEELKKQTNLLFQIAQNTTNSGRISARPDSYRQDTAATMTASPG